MALRAVVVALTLAFAEAQPSPSPSGGGGSLGKSAFAMSHPWAWKTFMEKYFPTAEHTANQNSTSTCVEWVKLCIDDGHMTSCSSPQGNFQLHSVGAYERDSGSKSMMEIETDWTKAMGDMSKYDAYFEYHVAFLTTDLDHYTSAFDADKVKYFPSTFTDAGTGKKYKSIIFQTPGSLAANAGSTLNMEILAEEASSNLAGLGDLVAKATGIVHHHQVPRASTEALALAVRKLASAPRSRSSDDKPVLTFVHQSFASSDLSRDSKYFEEVLQGSKTSEVAGKSYTGKMKTTDTAEIRFAVPASATQGPVSVKDWEAYQAALHTTCFDVANNQGFDRLADNHMGHALGGSAIDPYVKAQKARGLPMRFYKQGNSIFYYMYFPNGWGTQVIGPCSDSSLCPTNMGAYGFCTQGITGDCRHDKSAAQATMV